MSCENWKGKPNSGQKEAIKATKREHELELAHIMGQAGLPAGQIPMEEDWPKTPKFPSFGDSKDGLDAYMYLQHFERFATNAKWEKTGCAMKLSPLLSGCAQDVLYLNLSEEAAMNYDKMKGCMEKSPK